MPEIVQETTTWDCGWCNNSYPEAELGFQVCGSETVCASCAEHTFECERCHDRQHEDDCWVINDSQYCQSCFNRLGYHCNHCNESYYNDDGCDCESEETDELQTREMKPVLADKCDTFGVEIEAEGGTWRELAMSLPKSAGIHYDGSLSENGVEVVTPPLTMMLLEDYIPILCQTLKRTGYDVTESCGLHVHISPVENMGVIKRQGKALTKAQKKAEILKSIVRVFEVCEPIIYSMLPPSRLLKRWCMPLRLNQSLLQNVRQIKLTEDFKKFVNERYYGVNLQALEKHGTVEFRYHSGTMDEAKIINWVKILGGMVDFAREMATIKLIGDKARYANRLEVLEKITQAVTIEGKIQALGLILNDYGLLDYIRTRIKKFKGEHKNLELDNGYSLIGQSDFSGFNRRVRRRHEAIERNELMLGELINSN